MNRFKKILFLFVMPVTAIIIGLGFMVSNMVRPLKNPQLNMTNIGVIEVRDLDSSNDSLKLSSALKVKGISTFSMNLKSKIISVSYFPDEISYQSIESIVKNTGYLCEAKVFPKNPNAKQCPVPTTWLYKIADIFRF